MPPPKPKRRQSLSLSRANMRRMLEIWDEIDALTSDLKITNSQLRARLKLLRTELARITKRWKP